MQNPKSEPFATIQIPSKSTATDIGQLSHGELKFAKALSPDNPTITHPESYLKKSPLVHPSPKKPCPSRGDHAATHPTRKFNYSRKNQNNNLVLLIATKLVTKLAEFRRQNLVSKPNYELFLGPTLMSHLSTKLTRFARLRYDGLRSKYNFHQSDTMYGTYNLSRCGATALQRDPDHLLWQNLHRAVKIDHTSLIVEAELPGSPKPIRVCYKRYRKRNLWKALCSMFRQDRALRGWRQGHALLSRKIPTSRPIVYYHPRSLKHFGDSYLATEWIEGAKNLHLWGWKLASLNIKKRLELANRCAKSLGNLIGKMHANKIVHRDLKGSNILVVEKGNDLKTYVIDVDGVQIERHLTTAQQVDDLSRLATGLAAHPWITHTVGYRFLCSYTDQFASNRPEWKHLWRKVAKKRYKMIARKRREGKQVL